MAELAPTPHRFYAHVRDEGRGRGHLVPDAVSLQDAALRFVEHWSGVAEQGGIRVIAVDGDTGSTRGAEPERLKAVFTLAAHGAGRPWTPRPPLPV